MTKGDSFATTKTYEKGESCFDNENYDGAIGAMTEVIQLDPDDAVAHYNRGNAHYKKGDFEEAVAQAEKLEYKTHCQNVVGNLRHFGTEGWG